MSKSSIKPLGKKCYGSIGHLPCSRLGPGDHKITEGQARIATEKKRDKHDIIIRDYPREARMMFLDILAIYDKVWGWGKQAFSNIAVDSAMPMIFILWWQVL